MLLALKIDVDTLRGTREGVPNLVLLLKKHGADATFLFSLGPDHTGRAIKRVFRPGFFGKVRRTSVVRHYGVKTLLYGTVLPGPDIGRRAARRDARDPRRGFRGRHPHLGPRPLAGRRRRRPNAAWTRAEMQRACDRYTDIFGTAPLAHGAAGWQMNVHALRLTQRLGFEYCSDGRGTHPHLPVWNGELIRCPQLPTTLPTLDELIGRDGITESNVAAHLLERTRDAARRPRLHAARRARGHAPRAGLRAAPRSAGRRRAGGSYRCARCWRRCSRSRCRAAKSAPARSMGRSGTLLLQGDEFLADVDLAQAA